MAKFAKMPNSCELVDALGRSWAVQAKPVGTAATEYSFIPGLTKAAPSITTDSADTTTIDADGWKTSGKVTRALTIDMEGIIKVIDGVEAMNKTQALLKFTGEEIDTNGRLDIRIWRTDIDEGWEGTFSNEWSTDEGSDFRKFTVKANSTCAPHRIHSVLEGATTKDSVPYTAEEIMEEVGIIKKSAKPAGSSTGVSGDSHTS